MINKNMDENIKIDPLSNPHNNFWRLLFQEKKNIIFLYKMIYSEEILNKIHFDTIRYSDGMSIATGLKEMHSDLFLEFEYGEDRTLVFNLMEHKSSIYKNVVQQVLKYLSIYLDKENKNGVEIPSIILASIFYHGIKNWPKKYKSIPIDPEGEFKEFHDMLVHYSPKFIELHKIKDKDIKGDAQFKLYFLSLKYAYRSADDFIKGYFKVFRNYDPKNDNSISYEDKVVCLTYILGIRSEYEGNKILKAINESNKKTPLGGIMKDAKELLFDNLRTIVIERERKEGEEIGEKKGRKKGRKESAKNMKNEGFEISQIARLTGLTEEEVSKL